MKQFIVLGMLLSSTLAYGQRTVTGKVQDARSGEAIFNAIISSDPPGIQAVSDGDGQFSLSASKDTLQLTVRAFGYADLFLVVAPDQNKVTAQMTPNVFELATAEVTAIRARESNPLAITELSREEIRENNDGRDMAFILRQTPSMVVSSDAGTGIGYTGMRIRGSDNTRINVTVNGIPINDPESHGVFWVNMPDIAASAGSIQIQRGVGTSTNGPGAFGASLNVATESFNPKAFGRITTGYGSFQSFRRSLHLGTGLIDNHWAFEGRISGINSNGFIDRAGSDLQSYYLSGGYISNNTVVKLIHFSGREETYQAWWGIPEARLNGDSAGIEAHIVNNGLDSADAENLRNSGNRTYNFYTYENEVDHYAQDHYQAHWNQKWSDRFHSNLALHYTRGKGYFEQYRKGDNFADYGLNDLIIGSDTITSSDIIRRRWLDNHFTGIVYSLAYAGENLHLTWGGAYNEYRGLHYGELRWMEYANGTSIGDHYYDNDAFKRDFNTYLKGEWNIGKWTAFLDVQLRTVGYSTAGFDNDQTEIDVDTSFAFLNPKAGLTYTLNDHSNVYASVSMTHREPVRNDFVDAPNGHTPLPEGLIDYEAGYRTKGKNWALEANLYYMDYLNQLVLTGELNDVGSAVRVNVPNSRRIGLELQAGWTPHQTLQLIANASFSRNRISNFTETLYDYTSGYDVIEKHYSETDISYSPDFVGGATVSWMPVKRLNISYIFKYVGPQFMDNTSNPDRMLQAYNLSDLRINYTLQTKGIDGIDFGLTVTNLFNAEYEPNGYTYSYIYGSLITENFYYPMAGIQLMGNMTLRF